VGRQPSAQAQPALQPAHPGVQPGVLEEGHQMGRELVTLRQHNLLSHRHFYQGAQCNQRDRQVRAGTHRLITGFNKLEIIDNKKKGVFPAHGQGPDPEVHDRVELDK